MTSQTQVTPPNMKFPRCLVHPQMILFDRMQSQLFMGLNADYERFWCAANAAYHLHVPKRSMVDTCDATGKLGHAGSRRTEGSGGGRLIARSINEPTASEAPATPSSAYTYNKYSPDTSTRPNSEAMFWTRIIRVVHSCWLGGCLPIPRASRAASSGVWLAWTSRTGR